MSAEILVAVIGALALIVGGAMLVFNLKLSKAAQAKFFARLYKHGFDFLTSFPLTGSGARKIAERLRLLSVYLPQEVNRKTVECFLLSFGASTAVAVIGFFMYTDITSKLLAVVFAVVLSNVLVDKTLNKSYRAVLQSSSRMLSHLEMEYRKTKSIPDAFESINTPIMTKVAGDITTILRGDDGELQLYKFFAAMPFRPLQTLAAVSYSLNYYGDSTDESGQSGFIRAVSLLKGDINAELERIALTESKFRFAEIMPLAAAVGVPIIEKVFSGFMPGLSIVYNGFLGVIFHMVSLLFATITYKYINTMSGYAPITTNDVPPWLYKICRNKGFASFITAFTPKKVSKQNALRLKLANSLSKMKPLHFYAKKMIFAVLTFAVSAAVTNITLEIARDYTQRVTTPLSLVSESVGTDEKSIRAAKEKERAREIVDGEYFALAERSRGNAIDKLKSQGGFYTEAMIAAESKRHIFSDDELYLLIRKYMPSLSDMQLFDEVKRVKDKYAAYSALRFEWYYLLIIFALSVLAWFIPDILLKQRKWLIKSEAENDFMQLQTLVSALMYTEADTLEVLRQMARSSIVHGEVIHAAYDGYIGAPEKELDRLKTRVKLPDFKFLIEKLKMTISDLSLREAFSDLVTERETVARLRRIAIEETVSVKSQRAGRYALVSIILVAVLQLVVPMIMLGFSEISAAMSMLNSGL